MPQENEVGDHFFIEVRQGEEHPCPACGETHTVKNSLSATVEEEFRCPDCETIVGKANPFKQPAEIAVSL